MATGGGRALIRNRWYALDATARTGTGRRKMADDNCYRCIYFGTVDNYMKRTSDGRYIKMNPYVCSHPKVLEFFNDKKFTLIGKAWYYCHGYLETKVKYIPPPQERKSVSKRKVKGDQSKL